jgi:DNA mismatch endonuclease (patch repair protein)
MASPLTEGHPPLLNDPHGRRPSPQRSALMARIRGKDTSPEIAVRRATHRLGYRFRLHRRDLPGTPDLVFPARRLVLFVHGCFWHRHPGCKRCTMPKTRAAFWCEKFEANKARDVRNANELRSLGWRVEVVWECETIKAKNLYTKLRNLIR